MNIDPNTVRLTMNALAAVGAEEFYNRVDYYIQTLPNLPYEMALSLAVHEINKEYAE